MTKRAEEAETRELLNIANRWGKAASPKILDNYKRFMGLDRATHATVISSIEELASKSLESTVEMYDFDIQSTEDEAEAKYKIVKTNTENRYGTEMCFAYGRSSKDTELKYYYTAEYSRCISTMQDNAEREQEKNTLMEEIMQLAMFKESYNDGRLESILSCIKCKIAFNLKEKNCNGYVLNTENTRLLYNTGIVDSLGNYIMVIAETDGSNIYRHRVANSVIDIQKEKFSTTYVEPVKLYDSKEQLIFSCDISDIDLGLSSGIGHIIKDRVDRLPEEFRGVSDKRIYDAIKNSIDFDIKMQSRDTRWVIPFYNLKHNEIQYIMPLYLESDYSEKADLALIVRKQMGMYRIGTIITIEQAYFNATAVADTSCRWM